MENKPRISKDIMTRLPEGSVLPVKCNSTSEFIAACQNAHHIKKKYPRNDGYTYRIQRNSKEMTVTVSVIPKEELNETC